MTLLGPRHPEVRRLRHLIARRAAREDERAFVVEGPKLVQDALDANAPVQAVFVEAGTVGAADAAVTASRERGVPVHEVAPGVLARALDTVTPQPVAAIAPFPGTALDDLRDASLLVVCVDVRDPGNLGTVLRSAEAAGARGVICCDGSADVFGPKTVRASAGSLFHVGVVAGGEPVAVLETIGAWGVRRLGTSATGGERYDRVDLTQATALVVGNEAHGLDLAALGTVLDGTVTIPMAGRAESLNVAMATTVLCFEAARQRAAS